MKNINKEIYRLIFELIICVLLVFGSIPLWKLFENQSYAQTAYGYESASLIDIVEMEKVDTLHTIKNNNGDEIKPAKYLVKNYEEENKIYNLILKVGKNSTLDFRVLKIKVDDRIYDLESLYYKEDNYCYYFKLTTNTVESYDEKNHLISLWIDANIVYIDSTFNYQFIIEEI